MLPATVVINGCIKVLFAMMVGKFLLISLITSSMDAW